MSIVFRGVYSDIEASRSGGSIQIDLPAINNTEVAPVKVKSKLTQADVDAPLKRLGQCEPQRTAPPRHLAAYDWNRYSEHRITGGEDHALLFLTTSTVNGRTLVSR